MPRHTPWVHAGKGGLTVSSACSTASGTRMRMAACRGVSSSLAAVGLTTGSGVGPELPKVEVWCQSLSSRVTCWLTAVDSWVTLQETHGSAPAATRAAIISGPLPSTTALHEEHPHIQHVCRHARGLSVKTREGCGQDKAGRRKRAHTCKHTKPPGMGWERVMHGGWLTCRAVTLHAPPRARR